MPWYRTQKIFSFSYSLHAFQAAELGLGVALGNRYNAERYIKEGSLCVPFEFKPGEVPPTPRYFFSSTAQKARLPKVIAFSDWITKEARRHKKRAVERDPRP
jgi:LysR family glycine cleavage system transcriptional activator